MGRFITIELFREPNVQAIRRSFEFRWSLSRFNDKNDIPEPRGYLCSLALRQDDSVFTLTYRISDGSKRDDSFSYLKSCLKPAATFFLCNRNTERSVWTAPFLSEECLVTLKTNYLCCSIKHVGQDFSFSMTHGI